MQPTREVRRPGGKGGESTPIPSPVRRTAPASTHHSSHVPPPAQPEGVSKKTFFLVIGVLVLAIAIAGGLFYVMEVKPSRDFNPQTVTGTFTRDALSDEVPEVNWEQYVDRTALKKYYDGDGLELTFTITNDPRKNYATSVATCGIKEAETFDFSKKPRESEANALPEEIKQCVKSFLAPIHHVVPVSIGVDTTGGTPAIKPAVDKMWAEQQFESKFVSDSKTFTIQAFLIFDGLWLESKTWKIAAGSTPAQVKAVVSEVYDWLLQPQGEKKNSSIGFGILNGLTMRSPEKLRGGMVFIASDGIELSRDRTSPDALDFYIGSKEPAYLGEAQWSRFDQKILADNGGSCTDLYGAEVHWYSPPINDIVVRRTAKYWEHFLKSQCKAGSFTFHP